MSRGRSQMRVRLTRRTRGQPATLTGTDRLTPSEGDRRFPWSGVARRRSAAGPVWRSRAAAVRRFAVGDSSYRDQVPATAGRAVFIYASAHVAGSSVRLARTRQSFRPVHLCTHLREIQLLSRRPMLVVPRKGRVRRISAFCAAGRQRSSAQMASSASPWMPGGRWRVLIAAVLATVRPGPGKVTTFASPTSRTWFAASSTPMRSA